MPERHLPITTLDDVLVLLDSLRADTPRERDVRGPALAVAQLWLMAIDAGPERDLALATLGEATKLAVDALYPAPACS